MTPAERLLAAAEMLDKRASEATAGPWTATVKDGGRAWVNTGEHERAFSLHGWQADAAYIATMHPEVGKALAAVLRREAHGLQRSAQFPVFDGVTLVRPDDELLALADLLLAGGGR